MKEQRKNDSEVKKVRRFIDSSNDDIIVPIHVQNNKESLKKPQSKPTFKNKDKLNNKVFDKNFEKSTQKQNKVSEDSVIPVNKVSEDSDKLFLLIRCLKILISKLSIEKRWRILVL